MELRNLSLKDKVLFEDFLNLKKHELCVYSFENIYIWRGLFNISWKIIKDSLCVFFSDKSECFLYLPLQGESAEPAAIKEAFAIMDGLNKNREVSRIENIEEADLSLYRNLGYACRKKPGDYLCGRMDLAGLKGNRFKSKRAGVNYFLKNYESRYRPFTAQDTENCLRLYRRWAKERKGRYGDFLYQGLLSDNRRPLETLLDDYRGLNFIGRVVEIEGRIKAFTFGYRINRETFCILYEIADLAVKGLAQFIFQRFCGELAPYRYINIMDDSGLENLKKVKLSYHPLRVIPAYIATRQNGPRPSLRVGVDLEEERGG